MAPRLLDSMIYDLTSGLSLLCQKEKARNIIDEYIYFYNYQGIWTKTKLTPMELRCQFLNN